MEKRDHFFDNVKALLIILVIAGHLVESSVSTNETSAYIYKMIYLFHMPAFILVSGFFAKKSMEKVDFKKILLRIGIPYIIFQIIYLNVHNSLFEYQFPFTFFTPYWILWFMFSMILWHIMLYLFNQLKYPIFWAILLAIIAGFYAEFGISFSLSRTIVFFPFFLIGAKMTKKHIVWLKQTPVKMISVLVLVAFYFGVNLLDGMAVSFLWSSGPYVATPDITEWQGAFYRSMQYVIGLTITFALLSLIPKRKTIFSGVGVYTLYIFLTHGLMVKMLQYLYPEFLTEVDLTTYLHFLFISIIFSLLVSAPWVRLILKPLVEPIDIIKRTKK